MASRSRRRQHFGEPSAADVAKLIRQIKSQHIKALFIENMSDPRLIEPLAHDGGAYVGGTLYSDALSHPGEGAAPMSPCSATTCPS
jgi:zinc/manganese transport system substrate-binding protein